jgi:Ca2+-binding EF-hand superfamily protein
MDKGAQEKWKAAFDACDINGNGFIEPSELHKIFEKLNVKLDDKSRHNIVRLLV